MLVNGGRMLAHRVWQLSSRGAANVAPCTTPRHLLALSSSRSLLQCPVRCAAGPDGPPKLKYNLRPVQKEDVEVGFSRSSGAGGQNVNKLSTKVDMRFELDKQGWIPDEVKEAIRQAEKNRFTKDGVLVLTSQRFRTQAQNLDDALSKLQSMVDAAVVAVTPKEVDPETVKRVKQNIKAGQERRLQDKKKDSSKKKERRGKVSFD